MLEFFGISTEVLLRVFYLVLLGVASAVLGFAANWLKVKADATKADLQQNLSGAQLFALETAITTAVQAAEQTLGGNDAKLAYVKLLAKDAVKTLGIVISDSQLDSKIESTVYELKRLSNRPQTIIR